MYKHAYMSLLYNYIAYNKLVYKRPLVHIWFNYLYECNITLEVQQFTIIDPRQVK